MRLTFYDGGHLRSAWRTGLLTVVFPRAMEV